jgi:hypothetical protein
MPKSMALECYHGLLRPRRHPPPKAMNRKGLLGAQIQDEDIDRPSTMTWILPMSPQAQNRINTASMSSTTYLS